MSRCSLAASLHPKEDSQPFCHVASPECVQPAIYLSLSASLCLSPCSAGMLSSCESSPLYWPNGSHTVLGGPADGLSDWPSACVYFLVVGGSQMRSSFFCCSLSCFLCGENTKNAKEFGFSGRVGDQSGMLLSSDVLHMCSPRYMVM